MMGLRLRSSLDNYEEALVAKVHLSVAVKDREQCSVAVCL